MPVSIPSKAFELEPVIVAAETAFRTAGEPHDLPSLYRALGCCATSTQGDAAAITWHALYWSGRRPVAIAPSKGHSYRVWLWRHDGRSYFTCRVPDPTDHRGGVVGMGHEEAAAAERRVMLAPAAVESREWR